MKIPNNTETGAMSVVLRAKCQNEKFTQEDRDILSDAARMIEYLSRLVEDKNCYIPASLAKSADKEAEILLSKYEHLSDDEMRALSVALEARIRYMISYRKVMNEHSDDK